MKDNKKRWRRDSSPLLWFLGEISINEIQKERDGHDRPVLFEFPHTPNRMALTLPSYYHIPRTLTTVGPIRNGFKAVCIIKIHLAAKGFFEILTDTIHWR